MAYYRNFSEISESLITVLGRRKKKKKVLGELRANYKCSLLLCKSNVPFWWNIPTLPPVTLTLMSESKICIAIEDLRICSSTCYGRRTHSGETFSHRLSGKNVTGLTVSPRGKSTPVYLTCVVVIRGNKGLLHLFLLSSFIMKLIP